MSQAEQKVVQYLNEAHATEGALVRELQAQVAMTPAGGYRSALEKDLDERRSNPAPTQRGRGELDASANPILAGIGLVETAIGQTVAFWKAPLNLVRGTGG